jgi:nitroreductase
MNEKNELLKLIQERRSMRFLFDSNRPVSQQDLKQILEAGRWAPTAHNMQNFEIIVVDDKKILKAIGDIDYQISETFLRENYAQLSFSEEQLLKKKVGLLGTMFPPAFRNPEVKWEEISGDKLESFIGKTIQSTPILLIVIYDPTKRAPASEGDFLGIMSLGCLMENMWLMAQSLGLAFHIVSSLSADLAEKEIKKILHIPEKMKIAFSARLGYPISASSKYLRVRRNVEDFTHHNQFGNKNIK